MLNEQLVLEPAQSYCESLEIIIDIFISGEIYVRRVREIIIAVGQQ